MDNTALQPVLDALLEELAARVAGRIAPQRKELYTVQDLCERYGVSDDTITRWMRAGEFGETVNPTPRIHLVTLSGITEFDARQAAAMVGGVLYGWDGPRADPAQYDDDGVYIGPQ